MKRFLFLSGLILIVGLFAIPAFASDLDRAPLEPGITVIDALDAGTTAAALASGFVEANPLLSWSGDAAPVAALALKFGAKKLLIGMGQTPAQADYAIGIGSAFGAANNAFLLIAGVGATGGALALAPVAGLLVALAYADMNKPGFEKPRTPDFSKWHARETR